MPKKSAAPGRGRPSEISKTITDEICNALRAGAYMETAAALVGLSPSTVRTWLKLGSRGSKGIYCEFRAAVVKAIAQGEMRDLLNVDKSAMGQEAEWERYPEGTIIKDVFGHERDVSGRLVLTEAGKPIAKKVGVAPNWAASAWRLERKYPKRWARTEKNMEIDEHDETDGGSKAVEVNFVDPPKKK